MNREAQIQAFEAEMLAVYHRWGRECKYWAKRYLQLVRNRGGLAAARKLILDPRVSPGLARLHECGRADPSVEALVQQPRWHDLTDEERAMARQKLAAVAR